jgi:hypothetical protein
MQVFLAKCNEEAKTARAAAKDLVAAKTAAAPAVVKDSSNEDESTEDDVEESDTKDEVLTKTQSTKEGQTKSTKGGQTKTPVIACLLLVFPSILHKH